MYLQVMHNNAPALALYRRAGFEPLYSYHYREAPLSGPGM
jgi:ribosomal protein S18 acetylase RimI-like enzyme